MMIVLLAAALTWVQFGSDGLQHARAIDATHCPSVRVDGTEHAMTLKAQSSDAFPNVACDLALPRVTKTASIEGASLPLLHRAPNRIIVIGDTGCRIKGLALQACDDPAAWPFPAIAKRVAEARPDLIIHVGDYLYRETPCPPFVRGCANSPYGDAWPAWNADWFAPAQPMFAAAPLVLVRGNHEDCDRGGTGWIRYLDARAEPACTAHEAPYALDLGELRLVMFDSATANDTRADADAVSVFSAGMKHAAALASGETWLLTHKPVYGAVEAAGVFTFTNTTLMASAGTSLGAYAAILSGHLHTFEGISVDGLPPQIVNGISGDNLDDPVKSGLVGKFVLGRRVLTGLDDARFGYGIYTRTGPRRWSIATFAADGKPHDRCELIPGRVNCARVDGTVTKR